MNRKAHLAGVAFACIFGFTFLFSKIALEYVSPIGLISYRFLAAFFVIEALRRFKVITIRFEKGHWRAWLPVVLCEPIFYFIFETYGLVQTTSGEAGMMIALIPIFVAILSMLILKEKPRLLQVFFILLSVAGILFIQLSKPGDGSRGELFGFVLLFAAVLSAAFFTVASRRASRTMKPYELTYFMMLAGAVVFNVIYLVQLLMGDGIATYVTNLVHPQLVLPILYLGVVGSIGGFFLVNFALSKLPAHVSSIYSNLSTIVAIFAGVLILQETLMPYHYIGSAMILVGVYGTVKSGAKKKGPDQIPVQTEASG
ncbi:MAG: EamA family transporter [bacterium]